MSQEVPADDGAQVAPVIPADVPATAQEPTPAIENATPSDPPRDEQGRFESKDAFQKRVNELTWARRQAERERDELRQRLAAAEAQATSRAQPAASGDAPPALEDYADINQWAAAVAEHARKHAEQAASRTLEQRQQHQTQEQQVAQFQQREAAFAAEHPDYIDAAQRLNQTAQFPPEVVDVFAASEHGPAMVHWLGRHLDKAVEIAAMNPVRAAYELARIEVQVTAPKPIKPVTAAPAPVPTVGSGTPAPKDPDRMTTEEWLAWRRNQLKS